MNVAICRDRQRRRTPRRVAAQERSRAPANPPLTYDGAILAATAVAETFALGATVFATALVRADRSAAMLDLSDAEGPLSAPLPHISRWSPRELSEEAHFRTSLP
jgi:hypothetical protein